MSGLFNRITEWVKEIFIGLIMGNFENMFSDVNEKVSVIGTEVGQTPQAWNANIFDMVRGLSETVIIPIAGLIITFVLCFELITMITEKNNMRDVDTFMFFKYFFKMWVAVFIVTHTFDIAMAVFDLAQHVISESATFIGGDTNIDITDSLDTLRETLEEMELYELILLSFTSMLISFAMNIISVLITVILYGRMIEIYLYCSVAPIPFATMANREWNIGNNYLKGLLALGFQGFFIMVCVAIYAVLVATIDLTNVHSSLFSIAAYTVILCFSLFKTGSLAKSIFGAH